MFPFKKNSNNIKQLLDGDQVDFLSQESKEMAFKFIRPLSEEGSEHPSLNWTALVILCLVI